MADCTADCSAPSGDDAYLCRSHTRELDQELRNVDDLVKELDVTVTRQDRVTARQAGKSPEKPLVWNLHASEAASLLWTTVSAWALDVSKIDEDERDRLADVGRYNTGEIALWLARNMSTLRQHPEAGLAFQQVTDAARDGRRAIDWPEISTRFKAGPCPELIESETEPGVTATGPCDGEVWAFIPTDPDKLAVLRCQACDAGWDTTQWLRVGRRMRARIEELKLSA